MEEEEAKKIVESLTDSITSGEKKDLEESTKGKPNGLFVCLF